MLSPDGRVNAIGTHEQVTAELVACFQHDDHALTAEAVAGDGRGGANVFFTGMPQKDPL